MKALRKKFIVAGTNLFNRGERSVWRIMVPEQYNDGRRVPEPRHHEWEDGVVNVAGGLTRNASGDGAWSPRETETLIEAQFEDMRPVDILCTDEQIDDIIAMTAHHYRQKAVLAYRVSSWADIKWKEFEAYRREVKRTTASGATPDDASKRRNGDGS